jgi:hypothetical protein
MNGMTKFCDWKLWQKNNYRKCACCDIVHSPSSFVSFSFFFFFFFFFLIHCQTCPSLASMRNSSLSCFTSKEGTGCTAGKKLYLFISLSLSKTEVPKMSLKWHKKLVWAICEHFCVVWVPKVSKNAPNEPIFFLPGWRSGAPPTLSPEIGWPPSYPFIHPPNLLVPPIPLGVSLPRWPPYIQVWCHLYALPHARMDQAKICNTLNELLCNHFERERQKKIKKIRAFLFC